MIFSEFNSQDQKELTFFLKSYEPTCVSLIHKILEGKTSVFLIKNPENTICGVISISPGGSILHCLPDLTAASEVKAQICFELQKHQLFCINGEAKGTDFLVSQIAENFSLQPKITNNYYLMTLKLEETIPSEIIYPRDLKISRCTLNEVSSLLPLEIAYQKEEVLSPEQKPNPAVCHYMLAHQIKNQFLFAAQKHGNIIAKAGTNSLSWNWAQLGGVYTIPEFRRQGISFLTISKLVNFLKNQEKNSVLFVNEKNSKALGLYQKLGFSFLTPYKISYF